MKRLMTVGLLAVVVLGMSGCGCNRPFVSLFNRGDKCNTCVSANHIMDGGEGFTTLQSPSTPQQMDVAPIR